MLQRLDPNINKIVWTSAGEGNPSLLSPLFGKRPAVMSLLGGYYSRIYKKEKPAIITADLIHFDSKRCRRTFRLLPHEKSTSTSDANVTVGITTPKAGYTCIRRRPKTVRNSADVFAFETNVTGVSFLT